MEIVTSSSTIVAEALKEDNYERWSILMQHYLVAQDLWDVVQSSKVPKGGNKREWIKKNALALHAIGISCGTEAFDQIKNIHSAKGAWDALAAKLKPSPIVENVTHDISEPHQQRQTEHQETLQTYIYNEPISTVKRFFQENPNAKSPQVLHCALLLAITHGREDMARYFYKEIPLEFLQGDPGFFLLEECITKKMFDIALDLLYNFPQLAFEYTSNSTPIILTLAQTPPQFLSELGFWGQWIYKSTRAKAFPIKPRSAVPGGGVGIVQDKLKTWIFPALFKFHLVSVMIGLLCWIPCWLPVRMEGLGMLVELFLLFIVPLLKLDLLYVLIGVPLLTLVPSGRPGLFWTLLTVFIFLLVILRKLDKDLLRIPVGMPLLVFGVPISLAVSKTSLLLPRVILFALFILFSAPLLNYAIQIYNLKLMDEYALEVIRFICGSLSERDENQFVQSRAVEATFQAIKNGIPEIVTELITKDKNANILWSGTDLEDSRNMFACAVAHRQEKVAHFLHDQFGKNKEKNMVTTIDEDGNNILHVAAQLAPHSQLDHISGAPLQLQSELRWFKSVEGIVPRFYNKQKNKDGETPTQVFLREHRNLLKEAEEWMKKAAESCTVVGALVITIMFAAAFTVPGGNNEETGFPVFLNTTSSSNTTSITVVPFMVFVVSDSISLFAASSSVLMFMGILTSRYACQDFHISLPMKLIIGLSSLFISIAAMMVAFCATLLMLLHDKTGIVISIIFLATIPVTLFILLQSPLLVEIYSSTFRPDIFYRRKYWKSRMMRFCLSLNRRWWFRTRKGRMVIMLCALFLLYVISFALFANADYQED